MDPEDGRESPYLWSLVESMPRRLLEVISRDGNTTKYILGRGPVHPPALSGLKLHQYEIL